MKRKKVTAIALVVVMVFQFCLFSSQGAWADQNSPAGDTVTEETSPGDQAEDIGTGEGTEETAPDVVVPSSETEDSEPADDGTADDTGISDEPDNSGQSGAEPPASDEKTAPEPAAAQTDDEAAKKDDAPGDGADCAVNGKVKAVQVQGKAAGSKAAAKEALKADTDLSDKEINDAVDDLFAAPQAGTLKAENVPRQGDGSNIESIEAKWMTEDTVDNTPENAEEDEKKAADALLYVRPSGDENQTVVLKINYALSGEHNYAPGDVTITIPAYIFKTRDGKKTGVLTIPYPEDPSSAKEFNWKQIGDTYVLTNTRNMSAATKGFIEISIEGIRPSDMVDMGVSDEFDAYIEVVTHKGNTIAARSNALKAQFDTQAEIKDVSKRATGSVQTVPADQIPASQRIEGEKEYVKVNWYVWGNIQSNTKYTLDQKDTLPVDKVVATVAKDGKTIELTEKDMQGFIIGAAGGDGTELVKEGTVSTADGTTPYYSYATAYPASLFEADVEYTFHNSIECKVTEFDPKATVTNPNVNSGEDGQKVTVKTAEATTVWSYQEPEWNNPEGHFMVVKNGNDDTAANNQTHKASWGARPDLHLWSLSERADGWYGLYPSGINNLQKASEEDGEAGSIRLSYTIDSVGYVMPWMFNGDVSDWEEGNVPARLSRNYTNPVTMITEDGGVSFERGGDPLTLGTDYTFRSIEFAGNPYVYTGIPRN
ncbi:MAG: hypothetical protein K6B12_03585, partial [Clostridiales bacterium]|nr:hypothetical protein [Clostridiales bacterium]